jgi:hypothetical protein
MSVKWFVFVALMGLVPSLGMAQQIKPPGAAGPNRGDIQVIPGGQPPHCRQPFHQSRCLSLMESRDRQQG